MPLSPEEEAEIREEVMRLIEEHEREHTYAASKKSTKFHKADCRYVKKIKPGNIVRYKTREDAVKADKVPCKVCRP